VGGGVKVYGFGCKRKESQTSGLIIMLILRRKAFSEVVERNFTNPDPLVDGQ
jgi:phage terminase large subunit-like protein